MPVRVDFYVRQQVDRESFVKGQLKCPLVVLVERDCCRRGCGIAARGESRTGGVTRPWADCEPPSRIRKAAPRSTLFFFAPFGRRTFFSSNGGSELAAQRDHAYYSQRPRKLTGFVVTLSIREEEITRSAMLLTPRRG